MTIASGPQPANVLILGGHPYSKEMKTQVPYQGTSGVEFTSMLHEVGFVRSACRIAYVTSVVPPSEDISNFFPEERNLTGGEALIHGRYCSKEIQAGLMNLQKEIALTKPKIIIALGDTALWSLTGEVSSSKWRGSLLKHESGAWIIPTYAPKTVMKMWSWRYIAVQDLRRAHAQLHSPVSEPEVSFIIEPTYAETLAYFRMITSRLASGTVHLSVDIETRSGHIDCIGIAHSETEAISIPFCTMTGGSYWNLEQEAQILFRLRLILKHKNARVSGQNFLYDASYLAKHWGWYPTPHFDTMIGHAVAFPGLRKSLDFLASLYLPFYRYWKDEAKEADTKVDDRERWEYNCKDCVVTWELVSHIGDALRKENLLKPFEFEMSLFDPLMQMMMRGVKINMTLRSEYSLSLLDDLAESSAWFSKLGEGVWRSEELVKSKTASAWYDSPTQQQKIFYNLLGMSVVRNRKTGRPTVDDEALKVFARKEPIFLPISKRLLQYRSLGVFYSTFVTANLDADNRARTSYNPVGTETFRFSSSIDAFRKGMNLQNIPKGDE